MKFFFLISSFVLLSHCLLAQVAKGNKFVNGTVNLLLGESITQVVLAPSFGYFNSNQTAAGGSIALAYQSVGDVSSTSVLITPFVQRYFPIVEDKFFFFLNWSVTFAYGSFSIGGLETMDEDTFSVLIGVAPGFSYFPSERWSLDFSLSGFSLNFLDLNGDPSAALLLGAATVSPDIGFSYYF